jgi:cyclophilin family peptidyl-prolyl cis-trans isomerase
MSSKKNSKVKTYDPRTRGRKQKLITAAIIAVIAIAIVAYATVDLSIAHKASPIQIINTPSPSPTSSSSTSPSPSSSASSPFPSVTPLTSPAGEYSAGGTKVLFITSMGDIVIQMRDDKPITTANFVNLVNEGYYNNTNFQRVLAGFMIQGGEGATTKPTIQDEIGNDNVNSNMTIAMANTGQPNSASTQFFINVADNNNLYSSFDTSYTVFGQVIYGQNVVMAISNVQVEASSAYNGEVSQPVTPVTLIGAVVMP